MKKRQVTTMVRDGVTVWVVECEGGIKYHFDSEERATRFATFNPKVRQTDRMYAKMRAERVCGEVAATLLPYLVALSVCEEIEKAGAR